MGSKRKHEEGNAGLGSQNSNNVEKPPAECDSDSDEGYACEAPDKDERSSNPSTIVEKKVPSYGTQKTGIGPSLKQRKVNENVTASLPSTTQSSSAATPSKGSAIPVLTRNARVYQAGVSGIRQDDGDAKAALRMKKDTALTKSSTPSRPGERKRVWVWGNMFVRRAVQGLIDVSRRNLNLKNTNIEWVWVDDMRWNHLRNGVLQKVHEDSYPHVLVVHLGGNDLIEFGSDALLRYMKGTLVQLAKDLKGTNIVWSEIIARQFWGGMISQQEGEESRDIVNKEMAEFATEMGIGFIHHDRIVPWNRENYAYEGVLLSEAGIAIFRQDILEALQGFGCS